MAYDNSVLNQNQQGGMNVLGTDPKEKKPQDELVPGQQQPGQDNIVNISGGQQATIIADKGPIRPASTSATSSGQFKNVTRFLDANRKGSTGLVKGVSQKTQEQASQVGQAINAQKQAYEQQIQQGQQKVQQVGQEQQQFLRSLVAGQKMTDDQAQKFKNLIARKDTVIDPNAIKSEADFGKIQGESIAARDVGTLDLSREAEKKRMFEEKMGKVITDENVRKDFLREAFQSPEKRYTGGMSTLDNLILQSDDIGRQRLQKEVGEQTEATKKTFEQARREGLQKLAGLYGAETDLSKSLFSQATGAKSNIADAVYAAKQQAISNRAKQIQEIEKSIQDSLYGIQQDDLNIAQKDYIRKLNEYNPEVQKAIKDIDVLKDIYTGSLDRLSAFDTLRPDLSADWHIDSVLRTAAIDKNLRDSMANQLGYEESSTGPFVSLGGVHDPIIFKYGTKEQGELAKNMYDKVQNNPEALRHIYNISKYERGYTPTLDTDTEFAQEMEKKYGFKKIPIYRTNDYGERKLKYIWNGQPTAQDAEDFKNKQLQTARDSLINTMMSNETIDQTPAMQAILQQKLKTGQVPVSQELISDIMSKVGGDVRTFQRLSENYNLKDYLNKVYAPYDDILKGHDLTADVIGTDQEKEAYKNLSSLLGEQNIFDDTKRGITMDRSSATLGNTDRFSQFKDQLSTYLSDKRTKTNIKPANLYKRNALKGLLK